MISQIETKALIELALTWDREYAREFMYPDILSRGLSEPKFFEAIAMHAPGMLNSEQWLELIWRYRNKVLRSQLDLAQVMSEEDRSKLP